MPFAGRNDSYACTLNFLWRTDSLYIMDNHRAAAWCWLQHRVPGEELVVVHIDAHYDTAGAFGRSVEGQPKTDALTLDGYLDAHIVDGGVKICIYRWDNYISLLQYHHPSFVSKWIFVTHRIGHEPSFPHEAVAPAGLIATLDAMSKDEQRFILNLDLDYFRSRDGDRVAASDRARIFRQIALLRDSRLLRATTVCLSPEYCGTWKDAEELLQELMSSIGVKFSLTGRGDR